MSPRVGLVPFLALCAAASPGCDGSTARPPPGSRVPPNAVTAVVLTDVTGVAGLPTQAQPCLVAADFNGDGRDDLLLAAPGAADRGSQVRVYVNNGDGTYSDQARPVEVDVDSVLQCAAADLDRDGWIDVVLAGSQGDTEGVLRVLHNLGAPGTGFERRVDHAADLAGTFVRTVALYDHDGDGWTDLLVGYHPLSNVSAQISRCEVNETVVACELSAGSPAAPSVLLRSIDRGHDFTLAATLPTPVNANLLSVIDIDHDGTPEVFHCNEYSGNNLYRQGTGGALTDLFRGTAPARNNSCMGAAFADFNADGRVDLYVAEIGPDQYFHGALRGQWNDVAEASGVQAASGPHSGWSPQAVDLNLDGYVDVFLGNSLVVGQVIDLLNKRTAEGPQYDVIFENQNGAGFVARRVPHRTTARNIASVATALTDFDADGRVDIAVVFSPFGAEHHDDQVPELRLLHNETPAGSNHWLKVRLLAADHRSVVGASITLHDHATAVPQWRPVGVAGLGVSTEVVHFGLGRQTSVDGITVLWPGGATTHLPGPIASDRTIEIRRPP